MASLAPMAIGGALSGAQARNNGQSAGLLGGTGAIDGSLTSFWNQADPFNTLGHSSSGHALSNIFDPGNVLGQNQAANPMGPNGANAQNGGVPSVLPNLGAASMTPQMPQGGFMPLGQTNPMGGQTPGIFNQMAAQSAGQLFNPTMQQPMIGAPGGKGAMGGIGGGIVPPMNAGFNGGNIPSQSFGGNVARSGDFGSRFKFQGNIPTKAY